MSVPWLVQRVSKHARWAWVDFASTKRKVSAGFFSAGCCEAIGVDVRWTVKISAIGALLVAFEAFGYTG